MKNRNSNGNRSSMIRKRNKALAILVPVMMLIAGCGDNVEVPFWSGGQNSQSNYSQVTWRTQRRRITLALRCAIARPRLCVGGPRRPVHTTTAQTHRRSPTILICPSTFRPRFLSINVRLAWRVCGKSGFPAHLAVLEAGTVVLNARRAFASPKLCRPGARLCASGRCCVRAGRTWDGSKRVGGGSCDPRLGGGKLLCGVQKGPKHARERAGPLVRAVLGAAWH